VTGDVREGDAAHTSGSGVRGLRSGTSAAAPAAMTTRERVLALLARVCEADEVREDLDLRLFDAGILDSLRTVELILALGAELGLDISPAEFDRDRWATPRLVVAEVERRLGA
jgi:D-alanine--poly(phosphoribitol) ligase subunit 2